MDNNYFLSKDFLYDHYIVQNLSLREISEITSIDRGKLSKYMKEYGIEKSKEQRYAARSKLTKETNIKRYGTPGYNNREKAVQTCIERYGVDNISKLEDIKHKKRETCLERFGVEYPAQIDSWREKVNKHYQEKYGCDWNTQAPDYWDKIDKESWLEKQKHTKSKNHTFKTSKTEERCKKYLESIFKEVCNHYSDERYPFNCDFYIPEKDLFIELNAHWTHGGHPFDPNSIEDQEKLTEWKEKAKTSQYILNAIDTWTVRDPLKIKTARDNNINYITFYSEKELKSYEFR